MGGTTSKIRKGDTIDTIDTLIIQLNEIKTFKKIMTMIEAFEELFKITQSLDIYSYHDNYTSHEVEYYGNVKIGSFKPTFYYNKYDYNDLSSNIQIAVSDTTLADEMFPKHITYCCELLEKIHEVIEEISIRNEDAVKSDIEKIKIIGLKIWGLQSGESKKNRYKRILYFIDQNTTPILRDYNTRNTYRLLDEIFVLPTDASLSLLLFKTDDPFIKVKNEVVILHNIIKYYEEKILCVGWKDLFNTDEKEIKKRDTMKIHKDKIITDMVAKIRELNSIKGFDTMDKMDNDLIKIYRIFKSGYITVDKQTNFSIEEEIEYLENKRMAGKMNAILERYLYSAKKIKKIIDERIVTIGEVFMGSHGIIRGNPVHHTTKTTTLEKTKPSITYDYMEYEIYNKYKNRMSDTRIPEYNKAILIGELNENYSNYIDSDLIYVIFGIEYLNEVLGKTDEKTKQIIILEIKTLKEDKVIIEGIIQGLQNIQKEKELDANTILEYYNTLPSINKEIFKKYFATYYIKIKASLQTMTTGGGNKIKKTTKKQILGKERCIYKKTGDRKEYVKHKGNLITVKDYRTLMKKKASSTI